MVLFSLKENLKEISFNGESSKTKQLLEILHKWETEKHFYSCLKSIVIKKIYFLNKLKDSEVINLRN